MQAAEANVIPVTLERGQTDTEAQFIRDHCCPSPAFFNEPNRLTLNKPESESESESVPYLPGASEEQPTSRPTVKSNFHKLDL